MIYFNILSTSEAIIFEASFSKSAIHLTAKLKTTNLTARGTIHVFSNKSMPAPTQAKDHLRLTVRCPGPKALKIHIDVNEESLSDVRRRLLRQNNLNLPSSFYFKYYNDSGKWIEVETCDEESEACEFIGLRLTIVAIKVKKGEPDVICLLDSSGDEESPRQLRPQTKQFRTAAKKTIGGSTAAVVKSGEICVAKKKTAGWSWPGNRPFREAKKRISRRAARLPEVISLLDDDDDIKPKHQGTTSSESAECWNDGTPMVAGSKFPTVKIQGKRSEHTGSTNNQCGAFKSCIDDNDDRRPLAGGSIDRTNVNAEEKSKSPAPAKSRDARKPRVADDGQPPSPPPRSQCEVKNYEAKPSKKRRPSPKKKNVSRDQVELQAEDRAKPSKRTKTPQIDRDKTNDVYDETGFHSNQQNENSVKPDNSSSIKPDSTTSIRPDDNPSRNGENRDNEKYSCEHEHPDTDTRRRGTDVSCQPSLSSPAKDENNAMRSSRQAAVKTRTTQTLQNQQTIGEEEEQTILPPAVKKERMRKDRIKKMDQHRKYGDRYLLGRHDSLGILRLGGGSQQTDPSPRAWHDHIWDDRRNLVPGYPLPRKFNPEDFDISDPKPDMNVFMYLCYSNLWQPNAPQYAGQPFAAVDYVPYFVFDDPDFSFPVFVRRSRLKKTSISDGKLLGWEYCGNYQIVTDAVDDIDFFYESAANFSIASKKKMAQKICASAKSPNGYGRVCLVNWRTKLNKALENDDSPAGPLYMVESRAPTEDESLEKRPTIAARARALGYDKRSMPDESLADILMELDEFHEQTAIKFAEYDERIYDYCKGGRVGVKAQEWYNFYDVHFI